MRALWTTSYGLRALLAASHVPSWGARMLHATSRGVRASHAASIFYLFLLFFLFLPFFFPSPGHKLSHLSELALAHPSHSVFHALLRQ